MLGDPITHRIFTAGTIDQALHPISLVLMTPHGQGPARRHQYDNYPDRRLDRKDLEFPDDPLLETLYIISDCVITIVGPIFWICLLYLFFLAEFGK